jgi:hypothetical protein
MYRKGVFVKKEPGLSPVAGMTGSAAMEARGFGPHAFLL